MGRQAGRGGVSMRLALVLVALLIGAIVVGTIATLSGDDDEAAAVDSTTTTTKALSGDAQDLMSRLERGRETAVHVRLASAEGAVAGSLSVEIWRDGDLVRQDVVIDASGSHTEVSAFQLADGNVICQRTAADAAWDCQRAVSVATESGDPVGLIEAVAANLQDADVSATDDDINGTAVRCYAIDRSEGASSLCLTADGVPMRLTTQGQELTATSVDQDVRAEVFTPPGEVAEE